MHGLGGVSPRLQRSRLLNEDARRLIVKSGGYRLRSNSTGGGQISKHGYLGLRGVEVFSSGGQISDDGLVFLVVLRDEARGPHASNGVVDVVGSERIDDIWIFAGHFNLTANQTYYKSNPKFMTALSLPIIK